MFPPPPVPIFSERLPGWDWFSVSFQLVVLAGVAWIVWKLLRPRPEFQVTIRQRVPLVVIGRVRPQLLKDLEDVIAAAQLDRGTITGTRHRGRIVIQFSHEISPAIQQQIRNTWYANS